MIAPGVASMRSFGIKCTVNPEAFLGGEVIQVDSTVVILVADDEELGRNLVAVMVRGAGHRVLIASDGSRPSTSLAAITATSTSSSPVSSCHA